MALTLDSRKPIFPRYDYKYTERPKAACSTYLSDRNPFNLPLASEYKMKEIPFPPRATTTTNYGQVTTIKADTDVEPDPEPETDWKVESRGLFCHHHPRGNVNVICVKLSEDCKSPVPVICRERTKTRCTQTRYRESSAQTRPYLPEIANNREDYENLEVYQITKLLDSYEPPGEYEAKVVERARRRRKYEQTLKLLSTRNKEKHQSVVEAMEWEDWVAREEYIQGCQMLRMKIVEKMFASREQNLRQMSDQRINYSTERIEAKRQAQLQKINIEYDRGMRRLEAKRLKINRCYRKGNIIEEHIDPASDLHAPQMRFGVNPNRRHFVGFRKYFDDRIEELDKQRDDGRLSSLACPFSKLKSWSKPKQRMKEVTQRFCSDENLKKMYESLRGLRMNSGAPRRNPKCLKKKTKPVKTTETYKHEELFLKHVPSTVAVVEDLDAPVEDEVDVTQEHLEEVKKHPSQLESEEVPFKTEDEIACILGEFEGSTLGNLLQFLGDELERLKLQKKFQAIHLLAKKKRWWREAAEAGLRQNENKQREVQEKLFAKAYETRQDTSSLFLESVLEREFNFTQESLSRQKIAELAEEVPDIDQDELDLEIMLSHGIDQSAYERMVVNDYVRDQVFAVAEERFAKMKVDRLQEAHVRAIEEELYASVEKALANEFQTPEAICIVGEILDELIDNAVSFEFDIITPSSSESEFNTQHEVNDVINKLLGLATQTPDDEEGNLYDFTDVETKLTAEKEAKALIRKLIRKTVPQERWKAASERIVEQTLSDTFNDAIYEIECLKASQQVQADDRLQEVISEIYHRMAGCRGRKIEANKIDYSESPGSEISGVLLSVPSNIDIFGTNSSTPKSSPSSGSPYRTSGDEEHQLIRKFDYVESERLEKYEPTELRRCHERFNLLDINSQSHKSSASSLISEESKIKILNRLKPSSEENISLLSSNIFESRVFSAPISKAIYPDLPVKSDLLEIEEDRLNLMSGSYERASACFERASTFQERPLCSCNRSRDDERRSSF